ncbi:hypothetical protein Pfo_029034 [Paulownia fortunei]|nr:hypothetical protein Pfo_029034 [Paulownia fortunei]
MAANSSPAILPISNPQSASTTTTDSQQSSSSSAVRAFFSGISETIRFGLSNRRPWPELLDLLAISLLTNPLSLILLAGLLAAWLFLYLFRQSSDPPLTFFGRQFSDRETLLFLIVSTVVVIFLTSVGSVLVSALMVGVGIVCVHGAFRVPEDLFLDEQSRREGFPASYLSSLVVPPSSLSPRWLLGLEVFHTQGRDSSSSTRLQIASHSWNFKRYLLNPLP